MASVDLGHRDGEGIDPVRAITTTGEQVRQADCRRPVAKLEVTPTNRPSFLPSSLEGQLKAWRHDECPQLVVSEVWTVVRALSW